MELELTYKEFIENSNVIDSYWHYSELTEYINENFYKLPYTVSDIYMEADTDSSNDKESSKLDLVKGLGSVGKLVGASLVALIKSLWNIIIYVLQMILKFISFMFNSIADLLDYFTGSQINNINESIKSNFKKINTKLNEDEPRYQKIEDAINAWFDPFKKAELNTLLADVTDKKSWLTNQEKNKNDNKATKESDEKSEELPDEDISIKPDDEFEESVNNSLDFTLNEYFNEETSVQNIDKLLKIVNFYEYQKELSKNHYQPQVAIIILLNNLINSHIVLNLVTCIKIAIQKADSLKSHRRYSKEIARNEPDAYMGKGWSAKALKSSKEAGTFFPDLIKNLSNIQSYSKTLNNSICSKNRIKGLINKLINQKQSKIDIDSIHNELIKITKNIYDEIVDIGNKISILKLSEYPFTDNLVKFKVIMNVHLDKNSPIRNSYPLKKLKEIYNETIDQVKDLSKDFKKYSSQLGDLAKIKEIKFMTTTIKSLIPNIKMTNDYILEYQKIEKTIAISIKKYKEIHKAIQSVAKMSAD